MKMNFVSGSSGAYSASASQNSQPTAMTTSLSSAAEIRLVVNMEASFLHSISVPSTLPAATRCCRPSLAES